jgi:hypothetical protein
VPDSKVRNPVRGGMFIDHEFSTILQLHRSGMWAVFAQRTSCLGAAPRVCPRAKITNNGSNIIMKIKILPLVLLSFE